MSTVDFGTYPSQIAIRLLLLFMSINANKNVVIHLFNDYPQLGDYYGSLHLGFLSLQVLSLYLQQTKKKEKLASPFFQLPNSNIIPAQP